MIPQTKTPLKSLCTPTITHPRHTPLTFPLVLQSWMAHHGVSVKHSAKALQTLRARKDYCSKQEAQKALPFENCSILKFSLIVKLSSWMTSLLNNHVIFFQKLVLEEILIYSSIPQRLEASQMKARSRPISRWDRRQENDRLQRQGIGHNFLIVGDVLLFCHGMTVRDM